MNFKDFMLLNESSKKDFIKELIKKLKANKDDKSKAKKYLTDIYNNLDKKTKEKIKEKYDNALAYCGENITEEEDAPIDDFIEALEKSYDLKPTEDVFSNNMNAYEAIWKAYKTAGTPKFDKIVVDEVIKNFEGLPDRNKNGKKDISDLVSFVVSATNEVVKTKRMNIFGNGNVVAFLLYCLYVKETNRTDEEGKIPFTIFTKEGSLTVKNIDSLEGVMTNFFAKTDRPGENYTLTQYGKEISDFFHEISNSNISINTSDPIYKELKVERADLTDAVETLNKFKTMNGIKALAKLCDEKTKKEITGRISSKEEKEVEAERLGIKSKTTSDPDLYDSELSDEENESKFINYGFKTKPVSIDFNEDLKVSDIADFSPSGQLIQEFEDKLNYYLQKMLDKIIETKKTMKPKKWSDDVQTEALIENIFKKTGAAIKNAAENRKVQKEIERIKSSRGKADDEALNDINKLDDKLNSELNNAKEIKKEIAKNKEFDNLDDRAVGRDGRLNAESRLEYIKNKSITAARNIINIGYKKMLNRVEKLEQNVSRTVSNHFKTQIHGISIDILKELDSLLKIAEEQIKGGENQKARDELYNLKKEDEKYREKEQGFKNTQAIKNITTVFENADTDSKKVSRLLIGALLFKHDDPDFVEKLIKTHKFGKLDNGTVGLEFSDNDSKAFGIFDTKIESGMSDKTMIKKITPRLFNSIERVFMSVFNLTGEDINVSLLDSLRKQLIAQKSSIVSDINKYNEAYNKAYALLKSANESSVQVSQNVPKDEKMINSSNINEYIKSLGYKQIDTKKLSELNLADNSIEAVAARQAFALTNMFTIKTLDNKETSYLFNIEPARNNKVATFIKMAMIPAPETQEKPEEQDKFRQFVKDTRQDPGNYDNRSASPDAPNAAVTTGAVADVVSVNGYSGRGKTPKDMIKRKLNQTTITYTPNAKTKIVKKFYE